MRGEQMLHGYNRLRTRSNVWRRLSRFAVGLCALIAFAGVFASGLTPPGPLGEVLRHNQDNDIDASPLIYSDVEHMAQLEAGVKQLREAADQRVDAAAASKALDVDE